MCRTAASRPLTTMLKQSTHGEVIRFDLARTLAGRGRYWTTAYLVGTTLIDSGCAHATTELMAALADRRVERIINTHTHEDHIGSNGALQRRWPELEVIAHPAALPILRDPRREQPLHPYRKLMWGWPTPCTARAADDGEIIEAGDYRFAILHTPGHATDHLCVHETGRGWIFSGDLFVGGRDRALRQGCDIWAIIASLERIAALAPSTLFPGCARLPEDPRAALAAKITYLEDFGRQVWALHREGLREKQIMGRLCGKPMWIELITLGHFARWHLVRSFLQQEPAAGGAACR